MNIKKIFKKNFDSIFTIAEIGINHNGNIGNAIKLINHSKKAGFSAVKFQFYDADLLLKNNTPLADYQKSSRYSNMYKMLKKYTLSNSQIYNLKKYCGKKNIEFLATPFDNESAKFLNKIKVKFFKVSSGDLNNYILLTLLKKFKKPIILSTGMSNLKDIKETLKFMNFKKNEMALLHCISEYPAKVKDYQLGNINNIKKFGYQIGLSDHSLGSNASIVAISLGAKIIEKHVTLNKKMEGPDHKASLDIYEMKNFIETLIEINQSINQKKRFLTTTEKRNKKIVSRGLYFSRNLKEGSIITLDDLIALRPPTNKYKIENYKNLIGKKIKYDVIKNTPIKKEYFE